MVIVSRALHAIALSTLLLGSLVGCPQDPNAKGREPIAVVGDAVVDERRVLAILAQRGVARVADAHERALVTTEILEQVVEEELLWQGAQKAGIAVSDEAIDREVRNRAEGYAAGSFQSALTAEHLTLDAFREGLRRRLTQDAYLRVRLASLPLITESEIQASYDATVGVEKKPAQVRARQVLVRTAEEARHILELIQTRKITPEQAAVKFSVGLEADAGGDLGWFAVGEMPKVFDVCLLLQPGQVSEVMASDYGFHIFQVIDKREERTEPFKAVRDQVAEDLLRERQSAAVTGIVAELRTQIPVRLARDGVERLIALLPVAPITPSEVIDLGNAKSLDSHIDGAVDPIPPLVREPRKREPPPPPQEP
ncbi:MAG: peptidylprolyl isomerase [Deltaproteobacteria bacterium]|nr:peptidylprolyl isomerase [Deltaproteobacteria bacterium]